MWLVIQRQPRPDAHVWTGRRTLAALDAVAFPTLWVLLVVYAPFAMGVVGAVVAAVAILVGIARLNRAISQNERYRFTAGRWALVMAPLLVIAMMLKLAIHSGIAS